MMIIAMMVLCFSNFIIRCEAQFCVNCLQGPIILSKSFNFLEKEINTIYIENDVIFLNDEESWIKYYDFKTNTSVCSYHNVEIKSPAKILWISEMFKNTDKFCNFYPNWAFVITWMAVGNERCDASNLFQVILTQNDFYSFVIFNFISNNYTSDRNFFVGVKSLNYSDLIFTNHSLLKSNSNFGKTGKWLFIVHDKSSAIVCALNISLFLLASCIFYFIITLNFEIII